MKVIAAPGLKVPMEHNPRVYIDDQTPVEIEHTHYYVRRLADGDLVEWPDADVVALPRTPATKKA
ncbi:MAG: DUF2635 domain-containing protein [Rubrivivax sp.]